MFRTLLSRLISRDRYRTRLYHLYDPSNRVFIVGETHGHTAAVKEFSQSIEGLVKRGITHIGLEISPQDFPRSAEQIRSVYKADRKNGRKELIRLLDTYLSEDHHYSKSQRRRHLKYYASIFENAWKHGAEIAFIGSAKERGLLAQKKIPFNDPLQHEAFIKDNKISASYVAIHLAESEKNKMAILIGARHAPFYPELSPEGVGSSLQELLQPRFTTQVTRLAGYLYNAFHKEENLRVNDMFEAWTIGKKLNRYRFTVPAPGRGISLHIPDNDHILLGLQMRLIYTMFSNVEKPEDLPPARMLIPTAQMNLLRPYTPRQYTAVYRQNQEK